MLLKKLLKNIGFQIETAENGLEGIEVFKRWSPHFIWMDRRMPVMDGMEATRRIRTMPGGQSVKIVALTASVFKEQQQEMLDAGMDDLVRKPYKPDEIFSCMSKHLGVRFVYQDAAIAERSLAELSAKDLAELPQDLREELKEALILLDEEPINQAIDRISQLDSELGKKLRHHADNLEYAKIFGILETKRTGRMV